ncbi:MAG: DUF6288 domain-containing protein [Candidatus Brocadiia bacterium]
MRKLGLLAPLGAVVLASLSALSLAGEARERALRYVLPYIRQHDLPVTFGPTGASGYVARHWLVVREVARGSPAAGKLEVYDLVVGASGRRFPRGGDPRPILGQAITEAETGARGGELTLAVVRDGREREVVVELPALGAYGPRWPWECEKSRRILAAACRFLAHRAPHTTIEQNHVARAWNALLLLASGEVAYLDIVRRAAYRVADDPLTAGYQGWSRSYSGILLAEYYLATGDPTVLAKLRHLAEVTAEGQMRCGSWGHRMPWDGYGAVNQIGLACFLSLVLIEECGIDADDAAVERSARFFAQYAGKGWVPYGDHKPWRGHSGNGKNALAAVVYDLMGSYDREVAAFSASVAGSYDHREVGHTGAFFSFAWGPLGAALAPRPAFRRFLDEQTWYYDLARTHEGGLVCQPNPENLSGRTPGVYTRWGPQWTTGAMAMLYALPGRRLRILGGPPSVFARRPPALRPALGLIKQKRWLEARAFLERLAARGQADARELLDALDRMDQDVEATLGAIEANLAKGDVLVAAQQLEALERLLGKKLPRMEPFAEALGTEAAQKEMELGKDYYAALRGYARNRRARGRLRGVAKRSQGYYGQRAREALEAAPPLPPELRWTTLIPLSSEKPQQWTYRQWDGEAVEPDGPLPAAIASQLLPGFDDSAWDAGPGPFASRGGKGTRWEKRHLVLRKTFELHDRPAFDALALRLNCPPDTQVYLNGYRLVDVVQDPRRLDERVPVREQAVGLLRQGTNLIAAYARKGGGGTLDVALDAATAK